VAKLEVSGSFFIAPGETPVPETWVAISVLSADGNPKDLDFPAGNPPVEVFLVFSALFGADEMSLRILDDDRQRPGFYVLRVETFADLGQRLDQIGPVTLGIIVDDGTDRGQALACSCGVAEVSHLPDE
jgi:hypothetical protein